MEEYEDHDKDIAYSRTVKAGKRIYYLDVKRSRNEDLYLTLTESKKKMSGNPDNPDISFEKHKIFLYREDISKFTDALIDVIRYIKDNDSDSGSRYQSKKPYEKENNDVNPDNNVLTEIDVNDEPIKLNLGDFE
jgi:hypothetical protein